MAGSTFVPPGVGLLVEGAAPATPPTGFDALYMDTAHRLRQKDSLGNDLLISRINSGFGPAFLFVGDSLLVSGGASSVDRGWQYMLSGMFRANQQNLAVGGAVASWHNRGNTVGDGGWAWVANVAGPDPNGPVRWLGAYVGGTTYYAGDGVTNGGNWWVAIATSTSVTPAEGTSWHQITSATSYGGSSYAPMPYIPIVCYGNNDLGWGKELPVYQEGMRHILCRLSAGKVFENNSPLVTYTAGFAGAIANNGGIHGLLTASGGQTNGSFRVIPNTAAEGVTVFIPPDFPGGEVDFYFIISNGGAGTITFTVDGNNPMVGGYQVLAGGVAQTSGAVNLTYVNKVAAAGAGTYNSGYVVRLTGLTAGTHTITWQVTTTPVANAYFDAVSIRANPAPPIGVCSLLRMFSYAIWNAPLPTDTDVNTWNAGVQALVAEFSNSFYIDLDTALNKQSQYFSPDAVHPNDAGQAVMAQTAYDQMQKLYVSSATAAAIAASMDLNDQAHTALKFPVRAATATNITVKNFSGSTLDGATLYGNDRVLLLGQTDARENGLWIFQGASAALARPADFRGGAWITDCMVFVEAGATYGQQWFSTFGAQVFVGTDSITFSPVARTTLGPSMAMGF